MEGESDAMLLFTVLKSLFEQKKCSVDELLLEKLLNEIENAQLEIPQLLTHSIQHITAHDVDQRIKSFGLRLIALQISAILEMDETQVQTIHNLLSQLKKTIQKPSCPAVIKSSTLLLLRKLIPNDVTNDLIAKTGMLSLAVALLSDCSIFVCHEAELFLSEFLVEFLPRSRPVAVELLHHLLESLDKESNAHFARCVGILKRVCASYFEPKIEVEMLNLLLVEEDEFICRKVCEVVVVIQVFRKDYSKVDVILKKLTALDFVDVALKYCADLLRSDLPFDETTKLESYLLLAIQSLTNNNNNNSPKTSKKFETTSTTLSKLNTNPLSDSFQSHYTKHLCNLLSETQTEMPKLTIQLLDKLQTTYDQSNPTTRNLIKTTVVNIINSRMASDAVLVKTLTVYGQICTRFDDIEQSMARLLYHPNWAVQDSVLELIGQFISEGTRESWECVLASGLCGMVWGKLAAENCESFIRATGLMTLCCVARVEELWRSLGVMVGEARIVDQVMVFVGGDFEVVVRRAATEAVFCLYMREEISHKQKLQLQSTMQLAVRDLDWEVKLASLRFWKQIYTQVQLENHQHIHESITRLDNLGFCFALMHAIDDCDSTVRSEAASILKPIQKHLKTSNITRTNDATNVTKQTPLAPTANMADICQPVDVGVMEAVLNMCDSEAVKRTIRSSPDKTCVVTEKVVVAFGSDRFVSALLDLDFESVEMAANANADIYEGNLHLLLVDILTMQKKNGVADVVLDCY